MKRCSWARSPLAIAYHDAEWGVPQHDDRLLFEFLLLEGAQAGLSWETILRKREGYRKAFDGFDPVTVSRYDRPKVEELLADPDIVRNRLKIAAALANARGFLACTAGIRKFRCIRLALRERPPDPAQAEAHRSSAHADRRIGCHECGPEAKRVQVCRNDNLLRLYASRRDGE